MTKKVMVTMPDFDEKKDLTNIIANRLKNSFMKGEEISNMSLQQEQDLIGQKISTGLNLSSMYDSDEDEGPTLLYKHQKCYIAKLLLYSMLYNLQYIYDISTRGLGSHGACIAFYIAFSMF